MKKVDRAIIEVKENELVATLYETDYNYDDELEEYEVGKVEGRYLELIVGCFEVNVSLSDEFDKPVEGDWAFDVEVDKIVIDYSMCRLDIKAYKNGEMVAETEIDRDDDYWRKIYFKNAKISVVRF